MAIEFSDEEKAVILNEWNKRGNMPARKFDYHISALLKKNVHACQTARLKMNLVTVKHKSGIIIDESICKRPQSTEAGLKLREKMLKNNDYRCWI